MKKINPDIRITIEAVNALAEWALEQTPPLEIIAACDRALWWTNRCLIISGMAMSAENHRQELLEQKVEMAKEILAIPEEHLEEVIQIIRAGLEVVSVSTKSKEQLLKWCAEEEAYLRRIELRDLHGKDND